MKKKTGFLVVCVILIVIGWTFRTKGIALTQLVNQNEKNTEKQSLII